MPLFEVAIIEIPSKKEQDEDTGRERLVFGPKAVIAVNAQAAAIAAVMQEGGLPKFDPHSSEVLVRPFV